MIRILIVTDTMVQVQSIHNEIFVLIICILIVTDTMVQVQSIA